MDATGLALAVLVLVFLCWLLAPHRSRAEAEVDTEAPPGQDAPVPTGSSSR